MQNWLDSRREIIERTVLGLIALIHSSMDNNICVQFKALLHHMANVALWATTAQTQDFFKAFFSDSVYYAFMPVGGDRCLFFK